MNPIQKYTTPNNNILTNPDKISDSIYLKYESLVRS